MCLSVTVSACLRYFTSLTLFHIPVNMITWGKPWRLIMLMTLCLPSRGWECQGWWDHVSRRMAWMLKALSVYHQANTPKMCHQAENKIMFCFLTHKRIAGFAGFDQHTINNLTQPGNDCRSFPCWCIWEWAAIKCECRKSIALHKHTPTQILHIYMRVYLL